MFYCLKYPLIVCHTCQFRGVVLFLVPMNEFGVEIWKGWLSSRLTTIVDPSNI